MIDKKPYTHADTGERIMEFPEPVQGSECATLEHIAPNQVIPDANVNMKTLFSPDCAHTSQHSDDELSDEEKELMGNNRFFCVLRQFRQNQNISESSRYVSLRSSLCSRRSRYKISNKLRYFYGC